MSLQKENKMRKPKILTSWDFPDTVEKPDGYDTKSIPDITRDNLQVLIDEHNNMVEIINEVNSMLEHGVVFDS
jgi:hypothetical protein